MAEVQIYGEAASYPEEGWKELDLAHEDLDPEAAAEAWVAPEVAPAQEGEPAGEERDGLDYSSSFDPRLRQAFEGLAYLGHLQAEVQIPYHSFVVRTLKVGEKIRLTEMVQHLEPSLAYARAYRAAVVAAGLVLVDGKPLLVGAKGVDAIAQKYRYITDNWYDTVIEILYEKINELEGKALEVLEELGVRSARREVAQAGEAEVA